MFHSSDHSLYWFRSGQITLASGYKPKKKCNLIVTLSHPTTLGNPKGGT